MHEMSLTHDVVDTVLTQATVAEAERVVAVHLKVGEIHDIVDDLFVKCFAFLARDTIAEGAKVEIERIPLTVKCQACETVFPLSTRDPSTWSCPTCDRRDYRVFTGTEFSVDNIEVV